MVANPMRKEPCNLVPCCVPSAQYMAVLNNVVTLDVEETHRWGLVSEYSRQEDSNIIWEDNEPPEPLRGPWLPFSDQ